MTTDWKRTTEEDREEFRQWANEWIEHRMRRAHEQYGAIYNGNPLETVVGEVFDALFASWIMARNQEIAKQIGPWEHPDSVQFYAHHRHSERELYPSERAMLEESVPRMGTMLDVGCASGGLYGMIRDLNPAISYAGMDISVPSITIARERYPDAHFDVGSGTDIRYEADVFDLVTCFNVSVHEPNLPGLLKECYRVAKNEVLFDIRLAAKPAQGELQIAFAGEDTGKRTPYMVWAYQEWFHLINTLEPRPIQVEMVGYMHPVSHMAVDVPSEVFMGIFRLVKREH